MVYSKGCLLLLTTCNVTIDVSATFRGPFWLEKCWNLPKMVNLWKGHTSMKNLHLGSSGILQNDRPYIDFCHANGMPIKLPANGALSSWWFQPHWKILVKMDHFPRDRDENKKYLKPPPSCLFFFSFFPPRTLWEDSTHSFSATIFVGWSEITWYPHNSPFMSLEFGVFTNWSSKSINNLRQATSYCSSRCDIWLITTQFLSPPPKKKLHSTLPKFNMEP